MDIMRSQGWCAKKKEFFQEMSLPGGDNRSSLPLWQRTLTVCPSCPLTGTLQRARPTKTLNATSPS